MSDFFGLKLFTNPWIALPPLNFTLTCQVRSFVDQFVVQDELRKRIFKRFKQEGIQMPFHRAYVEPESKGS